CRMCRRRETGRVPLEVGDPARGRPGPSGGSARGDPRRLAHDSRLRLGGYVSEPKEFGDVQKLRRVKALGGTSSIVRFALRGSPSDFDEWEALGNAGWGFEAVLPYLRRLEADLEFGDQPWHGASGPIPVTRYPEVEGTEVHAAALEALDAVGF